VRLKNKENLRSPSQPVDAFGRQLMDFQLGLPAEGVTERSDGYVEVSESPFLYFTGPRRWTAEERTALRLARGRVLDLGCGAGRFALALQERGHEVLGLDVSPLALQVCRRRGLRRVRLCSVEDVSRSLGLFDTVLMMGNNLGLLENPRKGRRILRRLHACTGDQAVILAQTLNPYLTKNPDHRRYQKENRARGRMSGQVRIRIRYRALVGPWFDYLFVSPKELRDILKGTGWKLARVVGQGGIQYVAVLEREARS
jgi:2-polyprenyl-3-methyl-5-hydroxy-6-metoxy-1,4-benzoquinol methylase